MSLSGSLWMRNKNRPKTKDSKGNKKSHRQRNQGPDSNIATVKNSGKGTSNVKKMSLMAVCLNAWSICNKIDELIGQIDINRYGIVGIMETWLQGDQGWELNFQGYSVFRKDRS